MELVILLYSDNTWEKCLLKDVNSRINAHEWKNDFDLRAVTTIFDWCSSTQFLETEEERSSRFESKIKELERAIEVS